MLIQQKTAKANSVIFFICDFVFGTGFAKCLVTVSLVVNNRVMVHPVVLVKERPDVSFISCPLR